MYLDYQFQSTFAAKASFWSIQLIKYLSVVNLFSLAFSIFLIITEFHFEIEPLTFSFDIEELPYKRSFLSHFNHLDSSCSQTLQPFTFLNPCYIYSLPSLLYFHLQHCYFHCILQQTLVNCHILRI